MLINNAGVGIGSPIAEAETKKLDMQLDVNLRAVYLTLRECIPMLKDAGGIPAYGNDTREWDLSVPAHPNPEYR